MEQIGPVLAAVETETWVWLGVIAGSAVVALLQLWRRRRAARFAQAFEAQMRIMPHVIRDASGDLETPVAADALARSALQEDVVVERLLGILARGIEIDEAAARCGMTEDEARVAVACYDPVRG